MPEFSLELPLLIWILTGAAVLAALILALFYRNKIMGVYRHYLKCENYDADTPDADTNSTPYPGVSIIVYCTGEAEALSRLLNQLMTQDYPGQYEVTIVNDGSKEDIKDVYNLISGRFPNCNLTFIPDDAHNVSHRKLAITLGVKGARYDNVLILDATSQLPGDQWLKGMARNFAQGSEVVLGHAYFDPEEDSAMGSRRRTFDMAQDAVTYFSSAIHGHPYRGHGGNMGFNRRLFFDSKGFSRSLNLHAGEDDIFVSEIATPGNCQVELCPSTHVVVDTSKPSVNHRRWKRSHLFTGSRVRKFSPLMMGFYSLLLWAGTLCAVAAMVLTLPWNFIPTIICAVAGITLWILICDAWHKATGALEHRALWTTIPWLVMTQPIYNLLYRLRARRHRSSHYTWAKY